MKVRDKKLKKDVDVKCKSCPTYKCYWPRSHPGVFNQGSGYTKTAEMQKCRKNTVGFVEQGRFEGVQIIRLLTSNST